jgi:hypothetical protein
MTTTADSSATFPATAKALLDAGFVEGAPTGEAAGIDAEVCGEADCPNCGGRGLEYRPFFLPARRGSESGYVALGLCPACGHVEEF